MGMSRSDYDDLMPAETRELVAGVEEHVKETTELQMAFVKVLAQAAAGGARRG